MSFIYEHNGAHCYSFLKRFHDFLKPQSYLEIGTRDGGSLDLSACASIAIDPEFKIRTSATGPRPVTMYFQMGSDRFFERYNPTALFGRPVDMAFLDGLHEAETLLRDFENIEKYCLPNSVVLLHDCIPPFLGMTTRAFNGGDWTGDVWKIVPILKEFRPDIRVHVYDSGPTGVVCCTNLDPHSTRLKEATKDIWTKWHAIDLEGYGIEAFIENCGIESTELLKTAEEMRRYYWL